MAQTNWRLSFNGVNYPVPTDYKVDFEPIVDAKRNANGDMVMEYITEKQKVNLKWERLNGERYSEILRSRSGVKIVGELVFFDPESGITVKKQMYASPISAPIVRYENNLQIWKDVAVNFIEM